MNDEETNLSDDELIDDIDDIEEPTEPKKKIKEDDDLNLDELIEENNKLTNKYKISACTTYIAGSASQCFFAIV
ncbi:hypothetical protein OX284_007055 [Flavobacterium sp. SUN046]|uniref:hypothetical protein n=1 Tax=Flavobacterium sp. SUN046 TaxID=3002440 RepID=UPI002DBCC191|nr:hypothetical protein [Flavobacterium sp. SUN046]MEC4049183.1 hypothetical protein [Flavobacterium sp. SUN046]